MLQINSLIFQKCSLDSGVDDMHSLTNSNNEETTTFITNCSGSDSTTSNESISDEKNNNKNTNSTESLMLTKFAQNAVHLVEQVNEKLLTVNFH